MFTAYSRSSSPLSQPQSPRFPSPEPPTWSRPLPPCQSLDFIRTDRQSLSGRVLKDSSSYQWRYIPSFGIVHRMGCNICTQFINHMIDAECCQDFQAAVVERDNQHDRHFYDGMSEGRRKQKQVFNEDVQSFRAASQNMEVALARSLEENFALSREIETLKRRLQTQTSMRTENSGLMLPAHSSRSIGIDDKSSSSNECRSPCSPLSHTTALSFKVASANNYNSTPIENFAFSREVEVKQTETLTMTQNSRLTLPGHSSTLIGIGDKSSSSKDCQSARSPLSYAAAVSFKIPSAGDSASIPIQQPGQQHTLSMSHSISPQPSGPPPSTTLRAAIGQGPNPNNNFPRTLQDLHWLMRAAQKPGNDMYLAKVKALCAEAHATPRERKTELQKALLSKWRNPVHSGIGQASPLTNPRIDDSVEVWYSYLCTHQGSWPKGVRKDSLGRPIMSDLRASRIMSRLRPETVLESSSSNPVGSRAAFMQQAVELFSKPGTYQRILAGSDIDVANSLSYLPFHERTGPITIENLVRHCATCGITVEMAAQDFEPWARNYLETLPRLFLSPIQANCENERKT